MATFSNQEHRKNIRDTPNHLVAAPGDPVTGMFHVHYSGQSGEEKYAQDRCKTAKSRAAPLDFTEYDPFHELRFW